MLRESEQIRLSEYSGIYDVVVGKEHFLRKVKENIDFSFVNPMLKESYCENFGRPAKEPEKMFKMMFLKKLYDMSDEVLTQNIAVNMAYKFFLDMNPEDEPVDSSLLTKFRKLRITEEVLEEMLCEVVRQAIEKGLIKSRMIIVDATHSKSSAKHETPTQILRRYTKELRKELYRTQFEITGKFPEKPLETADLSEEIDYSGRLIELLKQDIGAGGTEKSKKLLRRVSELLDNDKIKEIQSSVDKDARLGHKSETNSFFGYKTHIAMTEERIITGIEVTTGEAPDGEYLRDLIEQSEDNGIGVEEVAGDMAYSGIENLEYAGKRNIKLISKLNPVISNGSGTHKEGFVYNKDADMYQCPAGYLAVKKYQDKNQSADGVNGRIRYHFNVHKCKNCPLKEGCYKEGAKIKSYTVSILCGEHSKQKDFQETDYFRERAKIRYMIEAKNGELKQAHGLDTADSVGVAAMRLQSYFTAFAVNIKRIIKLMEAKTV